MHPTVANPVLVAHLRSLSLNLHDHFSYEVEAYRGNLCQMQNMSNPFKPTAAAAAKLLHLCPTLCDPRDSGPPGSCPWDSPGKHTGVGCHFLLQCMKVKSESEVARSYPTLHDPMDRSQSGSSVHGISQARVLEWVAIAREVLTQTL